MYGKAMRTSLSFVKKISGRPNIYIIYIYMHMERRIYASFHLFSLSNLFCVVFSFIVLLPLPLFGSSMDMF